MIELDPNLLCQLEIHVSNLEQSLVFYEGVFGWKPVAAELHNYIILDVPKDCPYGVSLVPSRRQGGLTKAIVPYFKTTEPQVFVEKAESFGGQKILQKRLPGYGEISQVADPDGHRWGFFKPLKKDL